MLELLWATNVINLCLGMLLCLCIAAPAIKFSNSEKLTIGLVAASLVVNSVLSFILTT